MKLKNILSNAFDAIISSYEGKRFWPSLILRLVMALASAVITAVFANTLKKQYCQSDFCRPVLLFSDGVGQQVDHRNKARRLWKAAENDRLQYGTPETSGIVVLYCRSCHSVVSAVCLCAVAGIAAVLLGGIGE